jgi:hypothetical protein
MLFSRRADSAVCLVPCSISGWAGRRLGLLVVVLAVVDDLDVEAEGGGDLIEEPGMGEEPFPAGALAKGAAVVGGVQEAVEGCLGGGCRGAAGAVDPQQNGLFGERGGPGLAAEPDDDVAVAAADLEQRPASGLVIGVPDVVGQGVDVDAAGRSLPNGRRDDDGANALGES